MFPSSSCVSFCLCVSSCSFNLSLIWRLSFCIHLVFHLNFFFSFIYRWVSVNRRSQELLFPCVCYSLWTTTKCQWRYNFANFKGPVAIFVMSCLIIYLQLKTVYMNQWSLLLWQNKINFSAKVNRTTASIRLSRSLLLVADAKGRDSDMLNTHCKLTTVKKKKKTRNEIRKKLRSRRQEQVERRTGMIEKWRDKSKRGSLCKQSLTDNRKQTPTEGKK